MKRKRQWQKQMAKTNGKNKWQKKYNLYLK